jgi:hypothetical protein
LEQEVQRKQPNGCKLFEKLLRRNVHLGMTGLLYQVLERDGIHLGSLGGKEVDMCMTHLVQEEIACTERIQLVILRVGGWVYVWVIWPLSDVIGTQERFRPSP